MMEKKDNNKKKVGAKPKLTRALIERARMLSAEFKTDKAIYESLGIHRSTFYKWKSLAATEGGLYQEFVEALEDGHAEFLDMLEHNCLAKVIQADTWQSDAWILERMFPEKYARTNIRPYTTGDSVVDGVNSILVQIERAANE